MFNEKYNNQMSMFDIAHLFILLVFLIISITIVLLRNKFKKEKPDRVFRYTLASISLILEVIYHLWTLNNGGYGINMIPFTGLCASVNLFTIIALFTDNKKIMEIIYYWAFTGAFFSLLFVDTSYTAPHFRYFHYFIVHYNFMLAAIYYVATKKITLTRKKLNLSCLIIFTYSLVMLLADIIWNENWFYMVASPVREVSDFFGVPWYSICWIITIALMLNGWYYLTKGIIKLNES